MGEHCTAGDIPITAGRVRPRHVRRVPDAHPDYDPEITTPDAAAAMLAEKLSDDEVGAMFFYASLQAVDTSTGRVHIVAAILVRDMQAGRQGWVGGPWVDDVFVTPSVARLGIGSALLRDVSRGFRQQGTRVWACSSPLRTATRKLGTSGRALR